MKAECAVRLPASRVAAMPEKATATALSFSFLTKANSKWSRKVLPMAPGASKKTMPPLSPDHSSDYYKGLLLIWSKSWHICCHVGSKCLNIKASFSQDILTCQFRLIMHWFWQTLLRCTVYILPKALSVTYPGKSASSYFRICQTILASLLKCLGTSKYSNAFTRESVLQR
ncbi:hypothetical protein TNIN_66481 [Trichonephila inaurata madagascariensis]|uniref:Uncharacterized protein n=1 Tax=Trichonephila inaurata madagascariensis TaxID=2747483 RepID=A0A8X6XSW4_9ARAC|nr:hypothetical protein TNIN_66481 [Trichonephila inaurata madagascariensis]